jgi:lactoylglutathione lyase
MAFRINHIHLKAPDPGKSAQWWVTAFNFKIVSDEMRPVGDRFIRCLSEDGALGINISGARTGETPGKGDAGVHYGLEHFGLDSADVDKDVARLVSLGAKLVEGPTTTHTGARIAFLAGPDDVRIELVGKV